MAEASLIENECEGSFGPADEESIDMMNETADCSVCGHTVGYYDAMLEAHSRD